MVLDAILIALSDIAETGQSGIAILPEAKIGPGDGIQVTNPKTGYELWLSGSADYAVLEYADDDDDHDNKGRLLAPGASRADIFKLASGRLFLIEAKRLGVQSFVSFIPEAVGQAIALLKVSGLSAVRFCLSDGRLWMFFVLTIVDGKLTYYESLPRTLDHTASGISVQQLRDIVYLMRECLHPTSDVFKLGE